MDFLEGSRAARPVFHRELVLLCVRLCVFVTLLLLFFVKADWHESCESVTFYLFNLFKTVHCCRSFCRCQK